MNQTFVKCEHIVLRQCGISEMITREGTPPPQGILRMMQISGGPLFRAKIFLEANDGTLSGVASVGR